MRITPDERKLIRAIFKDNEAALKLMRKIFLPEYDVKAPLGQVVDLWNVQDPASMSPEECKLYFTSRRQLIMHVESMLLQLKTLANMPDTSDEDKALRLKKDSSQ